MLKNAPPTSTFGHNATRPGYHIDNCELLYEGLNEYQRLNHFPNSYEITRKDRLCFNYVKM